MHVLSWVNANKWVLSKAILNCVWLAWCRWWNNSTKVVAILVADWAHTCETFLAFFIAVSSRLFSFFATCRIKSTFSTDGLLPTSMLVFFVMEVLKQVVVLFIIMVEVIGRRRHPSFLFCHTFDIMVQFIIIVLHLIRSLLELCLFLSWVNLSDIILVFILFRFQVRDESFRSQNPIAVMTMMDSFIKPCWIPRIFWIRGVVMCLCGTIHVMTSSWLM